MNCSIKAENLSRTGQLRVVGDELTLESSDGLRYLPSADDVFAYAFQGESQINGVIIEIVSPESLGFSRFPLDLKLHIKARRQGPDFVISVETLGFISGRQIPIRVALDRPTDHVVSDGVWYPIAKGAVDIIKGILDRVAIHDCQSITLRQYLELRRISLENPLVVDETHHVLDANAAADNASAVSIPGFEGELYQYQSIGYSWLKRLTHEGLGCILADEMGLGKTVQIIALLASQPREANPSLIIAPATILENWRREFVRFAPNLRVYLHHGGGRTGFPAHFEGVDVVLTSYDTAVRDAALIKMVDWNLVIVDEAQAIKNPGTKRTIALKSIPRVSGIAVTGTPVENKLTDLWSITDFVLPGLLGDQRRFETSYSDIPPDAERLEPLVSPILLRRRVTEVASDLPPRIDIPQALEMTPEIAAEYEKLRAEIELEYGASATLVSIGKLRQLCAHPLQITAGWYDPTDRSQKYLRLLEILDEIFSNCEKALIFLHYHHITDLFSRDLARRLGVYTDWIDGRVDAQERQAKIDRFSVAKGAAVLLLNPRTAGTGLNLTAANHVIHYSPDWNPAVEDQASARAYRRGQVKPVTVHRLYFVETVEEVIIQRLERKRNLADKAVVGTDGEADDRVDILKALKASPFKRSL